MVSPSAIRMESAYCRLVIDMARFHKNTEIRADYVEVVSSSADVRSFCFVARDDLIQGRHDKTTLL